METLSDKGEDNTDVGGPNLGKVYWEKDVKEFIRELKEEFKKKLIQTGFTTNSNKNKGIRYIAFEQFETSIDELAGDKLI